jgi:hypothetical protein
MNDMDSELPKTLVFIKCPVGVVGTIPSSARTVCSLTVKSVKKELLSPPLDFLTMESLNHKKYYLNTEGRLSCLLFYKNILVTSIQNPYYN